MSADLRARIAELEAEVERLRASEEDDRPKDPGAWPTPGQWIYRWNRMPAERRLETATQAIVNAQEADECFRMDHKSRLAEADTQRTVLAERAYTAEAQGDRARAERDQLAVTVEQVREALAKWEEDTVHDADALGFLLDDLRAALDQAPAAEQEPSEPEEAKPRRVTSGAITNLMIYQAPPPSGYGPGAIGEAYRLGLRHGRGAR